MPTFRVTGGALTLDSAGSNYPSNELPGGGHIDNSLPPGMPPIGSTLPEPPPGVWPPLTPSAPIQPAHPIAGVPVPPGALWPPIWSGGVHPPGHPSAGLPVGPGHPAAPLPPSPGHPDAGLPVQPGHPSGGPAPTTYWVVCGIPGVGWRYCAIDPSLVVGMPLPPAPEPKG